MRADGGLDGLCGADDLMACGYVAAFALGHEGGPAAGDEGAGTGARDAGGGVHAAGPVGGDEILVGAEGGGAVEDGGVALGGEAVFMRVAAYAGDAFEGEVEGFGFEASAGEKGDEEGAEAAVDVEGELAFQRKARKRRNVVDDAVGKAGGGADKEDGVAVYEAGDGGEVHAVGGGGAVDEVDFDFEVGACFAESGVGGFGEDHFGLGDAALGEGFLPGGEAGHEDGFGAAGGGDACGPGGRVE